MSEHLKIALIGYGKMGRMIEKIALEKGHSIAARIDRNSEDSEWEQVAGSDVAIEFTSPDAAVENIKRCFRLNVPVVVGSTGWYAHLREIRELCLEQDKAMLTASNFSIGVNLFFHISKLLARAMDKLQAYNVSIEEIHHTQKLDAPSGTAISIAEGILSEIGRKHKWALSEQASDPADLSIHAIRRDDVPGTHSVKYSSDIDDIEIIHTAHNRSGFASGAVMAAEWLSGKKGVYTMNDVIGF